MDDSTLQSEHRHAEEGAQHQSSALWVDPRGREEEEEKEAFSVDPVASKDSRVEVEPVSHPPVPGERGQSNQRKVNHQYEQSGPKLYSDEAESSIIGAVLLDNRAFYEAAGILDGRRDFWREEHRHIWSGIEELMSLGGGGRSVDVVTLCDWLGARGYRDGTLLAAVGGPAFVAKLSRKVPSSANVGHYARIVRKYGALRDLVSLGDSLADRARQPDQDPASLVSAIMSEVIELSRPRTVYRKDQEEIDRDWQEDLEDEVSGNKPPAATTGIHKLDYLLGGGVHDGRSYYLGGLTKMGKTALALSVASHLYFRHKFVIDWISVEMSQVDLESKFLAYHTGLNMDAYRESERRAPLDPQTRNKRERVKAARVDFRHGDMNIEVRGAPDIRDIEMATRARVARLRPGQRYCLFVDYLQNIKTGKDRQGPNDRVSEVSQRLNALSKDLKIPVFILFQFDKEAEKIWLRERRAPKFSNVRGSSQPGNDANHLLVVHRNWRDLADDPACVAFTEVTQDLSRHGNLGFKVRLAADLPTSRFTSWQGDPPRSNDATRSTNSFQGRQNGSSSKDSWYE